MVNKISIQLELGLKGIEKRDAHVYLDEKLSDSFFDLGDEDIAKIVGDFKKRYPDAEVEVSCTGEDCCGRTHIWNVSTD